MMTRRKLIAALPLFSATATTSIPALAAIAATLQHDALDAWMGDLCLFPGIRLNKTRAAADALLYRHLPVAFELSDARSKQGNATKLKLVEVLDQPPTQHTEQFDLMFSTGSNAEINEGTHLIQHARLGQFPLYLTPARENGDTGLNYYKATVVTLYETA